MKTEATYPLYGTEVEWQAWTNASRWACRPLFDWITDTLDAAPAEAAVDREWRPPAPSCGDPEPYPALFRHEIPCTDGRWRQWAGKAAFDRSAVNDWLRRSLNRAARQAGVQFYSPAQQAQHRARWLAALRSGQYRQGENLLRQSDWLEELPDAWCCLGVACDVSGLGHWAPQGPSPRGYAYVVDDDDHSQTDLPHAVREWLGLDDGAGTLTDHCQPAWAGSDPHHPPLSLASINDDGAFNFDQIAGIIERGEVRTSFFQKLQNAVRRRRRRATEGGPGRRRATKAGWETIP